MQEMVFPAEIASLYSALDFVKQFAEKHGFGEELPQIELAVEEVFTNIAGYAYGKAGGIVRIVCEVEQGFGAHARADKLKISFGDKGKPFNPLNHEDPDTTLPAHRREIGGLGIFLTKKLMDAVFYEYKDGVNILTIEKGRRLHSDLKQD